MEEGESVIKVETIENIIVKPEPFDELLEVEDPLELGVEESENATDSKEYRDGLSNIEGYSNWATNAQVAIGKRVIFTPYNEHMIINGLEMDVTSEPNIIQAPFSLENYFHGNKQRQSLLARPENSDGQRYIKRPEESSGCGRVILGCTCYDCKIVFDTKEQLRAHSEKHVDFKKMGCTACNEQLSIQEKLQLHVMTLSGQTRYSCDRCGKSCAAVVRVKAPETSRPTKIHMCHDCESEASAQDSQLGHVRIVKPSKMFVCNVCDISFPLASLLKTHEQVHLLPCKICRQKFTTAHELNKHAVRHTQKRRSTCKYCNVTFATSNERDVHKLKVHGKPSAAGAKIVGTKTSSIGPNLKLNNKNNSMKSRNGRECNSSRDFKCRYCDVAYTTGSTLTRHLKEKHNKDKPKFVCELCKKDFSLQKCYDNHMNFHQIAKNYVCNVCKLAFLSKFELEQHMRVHDRDKSKEVESSDDDYKSYETDKNESDFSRDSKS